MAPWFVVTVAGPGKLPEWLASFPTAEGALRALGVFCLMAPECEAAISAWDSDRPNGGAVLRVVNGKWSVCA